jgi:hypothetical protein
MTLDEEFRKTMAEFGAGASVANERFSLNSVRLVAANVDGDADIWTLSAEEAASRAKKYRLMGAYALRGAAVCDERAAEARGENMLVVHPER